MEDLIQLAVARIDICRRFFRRLAKSYFCLLDGAEEECEDADDEGLWNIREIVEAPIQCCKVTILDNLRNYL